METRKRGNTAVEYTSRSYRTSNCRNLYLSEPLRSSNRGHLKPIDLIAILYWGVKGLKLRLINAEKLNHIGSGKKLNMFFLYKVQTKKNYRNQKKTAFRHAGFSRHHYRFYWGHLEPVEPYSNIVSRGSRRIKMGITWCRETGPLRSSNRRHLKPVDLIVILYRGVNGLKLRPHDTEKQEHYGKRDKQNYFSWSRQKKHYSDETTLSEKLQHIVDKCNEAEKCSNGEWKQHFGTELAVF